MYLFLATCQICNLATTPSTYFWKKKSLLTHTILPISFFFSVLSQTCVPVCLCVFVLFNILQRHFKLKQEIIHLHFCPVYFQHRPAGGDDYIFQVRIDLVYNFYLLLVATRTIYGDTFILLSSFFQCKKDERIFQSDLTWIIPSFSSSLLLARK